MCGILGLLCIDGAQHAVEMGVSTLLRLQHRGQDGAGITALKNHGGFVTVRGLGLIPTALRDWGSLGEASASLLHTRYATTGTGSVGELQPFIQGIPKVAMVHNGNIVNTSELTEKHKLKRQSTSDLDVLIQMFLSKRSQSFETAVQFLFDELVGSYAIAGLESDGSLFGIRDPYGIRPLFLGKGKTIMALASETMAFGSLPDEFELEELQPGSWVKISPTGEIQRGRLISKLNPTQKERFCMFEMVYFSSAQSELFGRSIYRWRFELGLSLAKEIEARLDLPARDVYDFVVPVPDTSRTAALAVAEKLGIPYREYLVKNNYVPRTFILPGQTQRLKALRAKLGLVGPEVDGKRILLVDDSVVRGNTSKVMAEQLTASGATRVSMASTCPPIRWGCYYGIDFPDRTELIAFERDENQIAIKLGLDRMYYLSVDSFRETLGGDRYCMACLSGDYPTAGPSFERFLSERRNDRNKDSDGANRASKK